MYVIEPFDIKYLRKVGIFIDDGSYMAPDNVSNVRYLYAATFGVGSVWGHNEFFSTQMMGAGKFGTSMNKIYGAKLNTYPPFEPFTIMFLMNYVFDKILPYKNLSCTKDIDPIAKW